MTKLKYYPILLHSHTYHSDGKFSPKDLLTSARDFGYKAIFITDHNTNTALDEVYENNLDEQILPVFRGIEWTTFYGHMLILGAKDAGNYTLATLTNMEEMIDIIKKENEDIVVSINHPFDMGNPICTGCHFEFNIKDYSKFDYLELINSEDSENSKSTILAYKFWLRLLAKGYRLAALAGRDWHADSKASNSVPINMIGFAGDINEKNTLRAIKKSNSYITYGPILDLDLGGINLGDQIKVQELTCQVNLAKGSFKNLPSLDLKVDKFIAYNNKDIIFESDINYGRDLDFRISPKKGYLRFEVLGELKGVKNTRLIITSPIFVQ